MSNFFSNSGADDHPSSGDNFLSFKDAPLFKNDKSEEQAAGGSFFDNSSSTGGGDHDMKAPSNHPLPPRVREVSLLSKPEGSSAEVKPTFLTPLSRMPPRKRQNQGPPPTPVCQPPIQQSPVGAKNTPSPQFKGKSDSSLGSQIGRPSHSTASSERAPSALSFNSQTFGKAMPFHAQQSSNTQINVASGNGYYNVREAILQKIPFFYEIPS